MAKKNQKKEFNFKLYAIIVFFTIAAALITITYTAYVSRYIAFHPEKVAVNYVDTVVQTGDGYNAYKNTVASKNMKYGDFIRKYYMYPLIYKEAGYDAEKGTDGLKGFNDEEYMSDATKNDDGTLQGQLIDKMYPFYEKLISENGWDDYDKIYTEYFNELVNARKELYGDDYLSDEVMFTVLEANVLTYGQNLTGTEDTFDENTGAQLTFKKEGAYQKLYGTDYKFTVKAENETDLDLNEYLASVNDEIFATYGVCKDEIKAAKKISVSVSTEKEQIALTEVTVVQIGKSWYVDNTATDTTALYGFYEIG